MAFLISGGIPKSEASGGGPAGFLVLRGMVSEANEVGSGPSGERCGSERNRSLRMQNAVVGGVQDLVGTQTESFCRTDEVGLGKMLMLILCVTFAWCCLWSTVKRAFLE